MSDGKIHIPARRKQPVDDQMVVKVTPEAYNALVEIYNESTLSLKQIASLLIVKAVIGGRDMATLYELTEEYRQLLEMMEDDSVDPEILQDTLEGVDGEIEAKADNCAKLIRELNGVASVINEEIERLKARKDVISNNADRVKKYLEKAMIDTGKRKFKTALFGFNIQKNPASVVVDQEDKIPEEYWIKQDPKLNKALLKKWLKDNPEDFAHLEQSEGLRIR